MKHFIQSIKEKFNYYKMIAYTLLSKLGIKIILLAIALCFIIPYTESVAICTILYILALLNRTIDTYKEKINFMYYDDKAPMMLESLIKECLTEYIIFNRGYDKPTFINTTEENKMLRIMVDMVIIRLSPTLRKKLELYYSEYAIETIISSKIYMAVLAYVLDNNKQEKALSTKNPTPKINFESLFR